MNNVDKNKKKRIAFYIGGLAMGGAERVICSLAEYFNSVGYEVFMVTKLKDEKEYELSNEIKRIIADITPDEAKRNRLYNLYARVKKLSDIWRDIKPDIILSFIRKNNLMALVSAFFLNIPVIVSVRSAPERELSGRGMKFLSFLLFRKAAGVVVLTNDAKKFFPKNIQKKVVIMPNGISKGFIRELDELKAKPSIENSAEYKESVATNIKYQELATEPHVGKEKYILTVGRIDDNKNQRLLVEAFSIIAPQYQDWSLIICGDGEKKENLKAFVKEIGLDKRVIFTGEVSDVPNRMRNAQIFALPSKVEGMPNALIEAMVMGMACISTDCPCGGPKDLIDANGENGILVPVGDVQAMAGALDKLMADGTLCKNMGKQASKLIERVHPDKVNLMWQEYVENIIDKYKQFY